MPVVQPQVRPREPSGFQKFLQTLQIGTNIAGQAFGVQDARARRKLEEERINTMKTTAQFNQDMESLALITNSTVEQRNAMLDMLGQDAIERTAAVTLGDVPAEQRDETAAIINRLTGISIEDLGTDFRLGQGSEIGEVLDMARNMRSLRAQTTTDPIEGSALESAALAGEVNTLTGGVVAETGGAAVVQSTMDAAAANEFLRMGPNGQLAGMVVDAPEQAMHMSFQRMGVDPVLPIQVDIPGLPDRMFLPQSFYGEIYKNYVQSGLRTQEAYARIATQSAADLAERFKVPINVMTSLLQGDFASIDPVYHPLIAAAQDVEAASLNTLSMYSEFNNLVSAVDLVNKMGFTDRQKANVIGMFTEALQAKGASILTPRNAGWINRHIVGSSLDPANPLLRGFESLAPVQKPAAGDVTIPEGANVTDVITSLETVLSPMIEIGAGMSETQAEELLQEMQGTHETLSDGTVFTWTPTIIDQLRQGIANARRR